MELYISSSVFLWKKLSYVWNEATFLGTTRNRSMVPKSVYCFNNKIIIVLWGNSKIKVWHWLFFDVSFKTFRLVLKSWTRHQKIVSVKPLSYYASSPDYHYCTLFLNTMRESLFIFFALLAQSYLFLISQPIIKYWILELLTLKIWTRYGPSVR